MNVRLFRLSLAFSAALTSLFLSSCGSTKPKSGYAGVTDYATPDTNLSQEEYPFDEDGNYLADVVAGKTKGKKGRTARIEEVAATSYVQQYEQPAVTPVYAGSTAAQPVAPPVYSAAPEPVATYAVQNTGGAGYSQATVKTAPVSYQKKPASVSSKNSSRQTAAKSQPKAKAKPVIANNKAKSSVKPDEKKSKPATLAYRIKRGDTLYKLANRYGTSVAAIKRSNGMSSTVLRDGATIKIPR